MPYASTTYPGLTVYTKAEGARAGALYQFGLGDVLSSIALKAYGSGGLTAIQRINRSAWNRSHVTYKTESSKCLVPNADSNKALTTVGYGPGAWIALCPPWNKVIWIPDINGSEPPAAPVPVTPKDVIIDIVDPGSPADPDKPISPIFIPVNPPHGPDSPVPGPGIPDPINPPTPGSIVTKTCSDGTQLIWDQNTQPEPTCPGNSVPVTPPTPVRPDEPLVGPIPKPKWPLWASLLAAGGIILGAFVIRKKKKGKKSTRTARRPSKRRR